MTNTAIIAGKGALPKLVIAQLGSPKVIVFDGEYDADLKPDLVTKFGKVGEVIDFLNTHNIKNIIFAGGMARPSLSKISPDAEGAKLIKKVMTSALFGKSAGDDKLLSVITKYMEEKGFRILPVHEVLGDITAKKGVLTTVAPTADQERDIDAGIGILRKIGEADIGQALVIDEGVVTAVEAVEGTAKMIERAGQNKKSANGVLIKVAKPNQNEKVDMPSIGVETIRQITEAGIAGIVIEARKTLIIDKMATIAKANESGKFIVAK